MKILIVGSKKSWAIESFYMQELEKFASIDLFDAHDIFLDYYQNSLFNKLKYKLHFSKILKKINTVLLEKVIELKPDVIWVFKGMEIFPNTLKQLKALGVTLVNYNADDPFDYTFEGSGNNNVKNSLAIYDYHFSYSKRIVNKFQNELKVKSSWLPFAYNLSKPPPESVKFTNVVCFIGNGDLNRANLLQFLAQNGIEVHVYGVFWEKINEKHQNIKVFESVMGNNLVNTAQNYYCQVNIFRPQNINSHNMRTFEMPALGCVMFAPASKEHLLFFEESKEAFFYDSKEELLFKLRAFLNMDDAMKIRISKNAYARSINEKYSYADRAATVYNVFCSLIKK